MVVEQADTAEVRKLLKERDELVGDSLFSLMHPERKRRLDEINRRLMELGAEEELELTPKRP